MTARSVPSTDGITLAVHDLGGRGPELVYSHATGFHGRVWLPLAARLADRYHGWGIDYRGHGDSTRPGGDTVDWRGYGEDCRAVLDALVLVHPFGLGHSKGGASLLMTEADRPGTFAALAVYEPVIIPTGSGRSDPPSLSEGARRRRAEFASYEAALANFSSKPPFSALDPAALEAYVRYGFAPTATGTVRLKCEPEHEARTYEMGARHGTWGLLDRVTCPVLVMCGDPSDPGPAQGAAAIAERIPGGRLHVFDHLSHFGPLQDPAAVAAVVADFFAEVRHG